MSLAAVPVMEPTLATFAVSRSGRGRPRKRPKRRMYKKACDAMGLQQRLTRQGIDRIYPHRQHRKFSPLGGVLGASHHDVQSVLSCSVSTDHAQEVMKPRLCILRSGFVQGRIKPQRGVQAHTTARTGIAQFKNTVGLIANHWHVDSW
jgi:hypothetical protein